MNHRAGLDRSQTLLFPESLEDYVAADNPVRFLDAFVSSLDLHALGFARARCADTGRPPYDPAALLKLHLYGYNLKRALNLVSFEKLMGQRAEKPGHWPVRLKILTCRPDGRSRLPHNGTAVPSLHSVGKTFPTEKTSNLSSPANLIRSFHTASRIETLRLHHFSKTGRINERSKLRKHFVSS
jgi:hypothetical protein